MYNVGTKTDQMGKPHMPNNGWKIDHVERTAQGTMGVQKPGQTGKHVSCHEINRNLRCIHT
jgi:hypothetical protein